MLPALLLVKSSQAHCPLCTVGAAAAAGGAAWLGVSEIVIGVFTGAFAVSIGWWLGRLIRKRYVPFQRSLVILLSFVTTILPLLKLLGGLHPVFIFIAGDYGSLLNRTYLINLFLVGSVLGGFIVLITPWLSSMITKYRHGMTVPYQGIILTLALLIILSISLEIIV